MIPTTFSRAEVEAGFIFVLWSALPIPLYQVLEVFKNWVIKPYGMNE